MLSSIRDGIIEAAGLEVDLRRLQLPGNLDSLYGPLFDRAIEQMVRVESGEPVNIDENRVVGHFWLRNPDIAPPGYGDQIREAWKNIEAFVNQYFAGAKRCFDNVLWIGIGGSALGPQMIYHALREAGTRPRMFFFDNTDPAGFRRTLDEIAEYGGLSHTLVVTVSKSGTTKETLNGLAVTQREFDGNGLSLPSQAVAVTVKGSQLYESAATWLGRMEIWDWVGGRTSLFSAVGLLPAMAAGFDWRALLAGARTMDDATRGRELNGNAALSLAAAWHHLVQHHGLRNMVVLPYSDRLEWLGRYLQQLVMESIGKNGEGITVYGNKGSTDQHAYVQQLREGRADFFVTFVRMLDSGVSDWEVGKGRTTGDYLLAFQEGTARALSQVGRPSLRITLNALNARSLGALIALYERAVGFYAAIAGINAYHQPGVEAGKKASDSILKLQDAVLELLSRSGDPQSVKQLASEARGDEDLVYDILHRLAVQQRHGVVLTSVGASAGECEFVHQRP